MKKYVYIAIIVVPGLVAVIRGADADRPAVHLGLTRSFTGTEHSEKSHRLALFWDNGDFELWDTRRANRIGRVERLPRPVGWCTASPDGATIVTADRLPNSKSAADLEARFGGFPATLILWHAESGARMHTIRLSEAEWHRTFVHDWYPLWLDATQLLVVRLWRQSPTRPVCLVRLFVIDTVAGKVVKDSDELQCAGQHLILSPDRTMGLLKPDARRRRQKETDGWDSVFIYAYTYVLNMDRLAFAYSVREPSDGKRRNEDDDCILIAQWSPDGKTVLTVDGVPDPKVKLWEAKTGKLLTTLKGHRDYILDVAWSPAGDKLLTASEDRTVRVWDVPTGKLDLELVGHTAGLNKVMVLRDGRIAVTAAEEPVVRVWDLASGKLSFELPGHDSAVRELEPLSDTLVRTVTLRGTSTTWDCATGRRLDVTPMPPRFPKRFGNCEIVEKGKELQMLTVASTPPGPQ